LARAVLDEPTLDVFHRASPLHEPARGQREDRRLLVVSQFRASVRADSSILGIRLFRPDCLDRMLSARHGMSGNSSPEAANPLRFRLRELHTE